MPFLNTFFCPPPPLPFSLQLSPPPSLPSFSFCCYDDNTNGDADGSYKCRWMKKVGKLAVQTFGQFFLLYRSRHALTQKCLGGTPPVGKEKPALAMGNAGGGLKLVRRCRGMLPLGPGGGLAARQLGAALLERQRQAAAAAAHAAVPPGDEAEVEGLPGEAPALDVQAPGRPLRPNFLVNNAA